MIRLATIGRGPIVDCFLNGLNHTDKYTLEAVYSRNKEDGKAFAEKHGAKKVYTDLSDLANDKDIDAVYIASPNVFHAPQSEILLKGGKHILCEKPIAVSSEEYLKTKSLADSLGLIYMEAIIPRYVESRENIVNAVKEIGSIAMAKIDYCQLTSRYERLLKGEHINIFDMSLAAGSLMDIGVYCVYAACDLLGVPKDIKATSYTLKNGADGGGTAIFDYGTFTAAVTYSKVGQSMVPCEIIGDKGSVIIEKIGLYQGAYLLKDGQKIPLLEETKKDKLMSMEAVYFADFIEGKKLDIYEKSSELCLNVHKCMDKIKKQADIKYTY